ncbi:MAG: hypothetical protein M4579_003620 [Chaenotheca gracillima]|nr:MAG: hypothetical protein M4579_003620 [Chaenotheca gracillima]
MSARAALRKETLMSRRQVEGMIADGRTIVIVDNKVLKLDAWIRFHPGGDLAIKHMVGRDATDEVNALHSPEARRKMSSYQIGRVHGQWDNLTPPVQGGKFRPFIEDASDLESGSESDLITTSESSSGKSSPLFEPVDKAPSTSSLRQRLTPVDHAAADPVTPMEPHLAHLDDLTRQELDLTRAKYPSLSAATQASIVQKYRDLNVRIRAEGLYQCNYTSYLIELSRYTLFFGLSLYFLHLGWWATAGLFLGIFWHQLVFTAHDAGHMGITHNFHTDTVIGMIVADYLGGLSLGWWKRSHNVHHVVTNLPEHDPDIELMPFFAISHRFFQSLRSTYYDRIMPYDAVARVAVRYQSYLYYPILTLGRFNLYLLSWEHLLRGLGPRKGEAAWHRWFEITGHVFFWIWFGYGILYRTIPTWWGRFVFIMVSHMVTAPLHVQITLSHFAMSTANVGTKESFPQRMLRTTMDVDCPEWLDFVHGGLQFQAVHHLYPRIPRHNLRRTQRLVREFCHDVGIPYALFGFVDGNKQVISHLAEIGRQATILGECQRTVAGEALSTVAVREEPPHVSI